MKSASAPLRSGAREPGRQLSAFHQDRANRLPEQTQRRVYSCAASALRRGGGVENFFAGRVSPNGSFKNGRHVCTRSNDSNHGDLPPTSPLPPVRLPYDSLRGTHTRHGDQNILK